jgi:simple sugar transport system permease protein
VFRRFSEITILLIITVAVTVVMTVMSPGRFLTFGNLQSMAFQLPELGLLSLAMMITMLSGGINLAIIATANLAGIVVATVMIRFISTGTAGGLTAGIMLLAFLAGLAVAVLAGFIGGFLIAQVGVSPILATLGMMTLLNGVNIVLTRGYAISGFPPSFAFIGNGTILGVPFCLIVFILCSLIMALVLNRTVLGYHVYMIGSNWMATLFSGVNNRAVLIKTYLISGIFSWVASLIMVSRFNSAKSSYGEGYLLITILAAVLGGTSTIGGFGRVSGLVIALVILQLISSGLNMRGVSAFLTLSMWGVTIILVMAANYASGRYRQRRVREEKRNL